MNWIFGYCHFHLYYLYNAQGMHALGMLLCLNKMYMKCKMLLTLISCTSKHLQVLFTYRLKSLWQMSSILLVISLLDIVEGAVCVHLLSRFMIVVHPSGSASHPGVLLVLPAVQE